MNPRRCVECGLSFPAYLLLLFATGFGCVQEDHSAPPNILFAIADDASFPHMSAYGTKWVNTPAFDYVAKHGLLFNKAYTTNAKCAPSRATILTGRNSWQLEEACNHWPRFPEKFITFAEVLPNDGYFVGHTAKGWSPGIAEKKGQKRDLIGPAFNQHQLDPPGQFMSANDYARNFAAFLEAAPKDAPWFFWYGAIEPHRAYEYGIAQRLTDKKTGDIPEIPPFWPDTDSVRNDMLDYAFEIEYFDQHLHSMIELLNDKDMLHNTMVVVTADNGMPFPRVKGQVYEMDHHLPLAIMWPAGINEPGRAVDAFVSFSDFAPTFLELAGNNISENGMAAMSGSSLLEIFDGGQNSKWPNRDHMLIGKERHDVGRPNDWGYPVRGIVTDEYLLTINFEPDRWPAGNPETGYLNCDGSPTKSNILSLMRNAQDNSFWNLSFGKRPAEELYDLKQDPFCTNNLIDHSQHIEIASELKTQLLHELKEQGDPRVMERGHVFDEYPYADAKTAQFYQRWQKGEELRAGWVNSSDFEVLTQINN